MKESIINLKNVDFSYSRKTELLSDINLNLSAGHIHGLLGKNGEGKSTLLKLFSGLVFPNDGEVDVMGYAPAKRPYGLLKDTFFLPEELPEINLTVEQYEKVYAPFYPNFGKEQFDYYLKEFDIESAKTGINKMSQGQKKKVLIAFGLACNTRILLMDEPTNGLDIPSKGQFRKMVASVTDEEKIIIISTHQVRDLDSLIDSIIIMENHKIVLNETIENITRKLLFKVSDRGEKAGDVIYAEDVLKGYYQVCENKSGEDSKLDIELLFNAVVSNTERINNIFKS